MARVRICNEKPKVSDNVKELETLVDELGNKKPISDNLKKEVDKLKTKIKSIFISQDLREYTSKNNYCVEVSDRVKESFNEDELIKWATKHKKPIIKQITVIDYDALEDEVYKGRINPIDLAPFQVRVVEKVLKAKFIRNND